MLRHLGTEPKPDGRESDKHGRQLSVCVHTLTKVGEDPSSHRSAQGIEWITSFRRRHADTTLFNIILN